MFDFRYHIASLIAVFLALTVGLLVGGSVAGSHAIQEEQQQLVKKLEVDFQALREQNRLLKKEADSYRQSESHYKSFAEEVLPVVIAGKLEGRRVAIIDTTGNGDGVSVTTALSTAGAELVSSISFANNWRFPPRNRLVALARELGLMGVHGERDFWIQLARVVGDGISGGPGQKALQAMHSLKLISFSEYKGPPQAVVLVGGGPEGQVETARLLDIPLIRYFKEKDIQVIGVESSKAVSSYIHFYQESNIPTVDDIDTVSGQVALIWSLSGSPGNYGIKPTARQNLPVLLQEKIKAAGGGGP